MRTMVTAAVLAVLVAGCPAPAPEQTCTPEETEICSCSSSQGTRNCSADGTAWSACDCSSSPDGGVGDGGGGEDAGGDAGQEDAGAWHECEVPRDCGAGYDCVLGSDGYRDCVKLSCVEDTDCNTGAGEHCDTRRGICLEDTCRSGAADACTGGAVCLGGTCAAPPPPPASCALSPSGTVVHAGSTTALAARGHTGTGALAPFARFTWSSDDGSCASVDAAGVVTGGAVSASCSATITASPVGGGTPCSASVTTVPAVALPGVRVVIVEQPGGGPVVGAQVLVRTDDGAGGNVVALSPASSDSRGVASVADIGTSVASHLLDVSVFHAAYDYVTVVRPGSGDLFVTLQRTQATTVMAGVRSSAVDAIDFNPVRALGDLKLGFVGLSSPWAAADAPPLHAFGLPVVRDVMLEGVGSFEDVVLPSTFYFGLGAAAVKDDFQAFGAPGARSLWGFAGRLRLAEVGPALSSDLADGDATFFSSLFRVALPRLGIFHHGLRGGIELVEVARPGDGSEPGTWSFGTDPQQLVPGPLLSQTVSVQVPTLPTLPGRSSEHAHGVVVTLASLVPGQGGVSLGAGAGYDAPAATDPRDGVIDPMACPDTDPGCAQPSSGEVYLDFAPPHDGLEGTPYLLVAAARDLRRLEQLDLPVSMLFAITDAVAADSSFPAGAFLGFASGATYTQGASYQQATAVAGADFYRLVLSAGGHGWQVYFDDATDVSLPAPPNGFEDRTSAARIQAFATSGHAVGVAELFAFNATNLDDLGLLTTAFSDHACQPVEQPRSGSCDGDAGYTLDVSTGLCVGGPDAIVAFPASTASPCSGLSGYEPVHVSGAGSAGICARTPACRVE